MRPLGSRVKIFPFLDFFFFFDFVSAFLFFVFSPVFCFNLRFFYIFFFLYFPCVSFHFSSSLHSGKSEVTRVTEPKFPSL